MFRALVPSESWGFCVRERKDFRQMHICMPDNVNLIISTLIRAGFEAYAVGGCVRDALLGREPHDWDITTSAMPEQVKKLFDRTVDTGIQHGTVTVMIGAEGYEVTTYRIDGKYSDGRHPDSVSFTRSLEEDLLRRDFTINAMAYSHEFGLRDLFGGVDDLNSGIIRCVGNAMQRFGEDALRILRAVRFSAQLGFEIAPDTLDAAAALVGSLSLISAERIHVELNKLLESPHPDRLRYLNSLGIDKVVFPELEKIFLNGESEHVIEILSDRPLPLLLRWAVLLYYTGSSAAVLTRLKSDNYKLDTVHKLISFAHRPVDGLSDHEMRQLLHDFGAENIDMLFDFRSAIDGCSLEASRLQAAAILERGECTSLKGLAISGRDLIRLGIPSGPSLGDILDGLLDKVLEDPSLNTVERLTALVKGNAPQ